MLLHFILIFYKLTYGKAAHCMRLFSIMPGFPKINYFQSPSLYIAVKNNNHIIYFYFV